MAADLTASIITSVFILLFFLYYLIRDYNLTRRRDSKRSTTARLPPGDMGLPWIGETMEFFRASQSNRLYEDFIAPRVEKHASSTFKTRLMGSPTVIVNGDRANRFFLSNEFKLVVSAWPSTAVELMGPTSIMEKRGDPHRLARGIVTSCFGPLGLDSLAPKISSSVQAHLKAHWATRNNNNDGDESKTISLFKSAKRVAFGVVCECLLEMEAKEELLGMFEKVLEGVFAAKVEVPGTRFWRAKKARKEIEKAVLEAVRRKMSAERGGRGESETTSFSLMGRLVEAMVRGDMTEEEVVDNAVLLVFAAIDTTSFAVAMTFKMLAQNPDCFSLLLKEHWKIMKRRGREGILRMEEVKEMEYTWQVVRETLRMQPPIFGSFRKAITDIEFDGFFIPKGWKVLWTTYGTHKSEEYFKKPEVFDPTRFEEAMPPYVYVPFGGGPRLCAGYQLSKLNILIFVHHVVTQYDWSLLHPHESITVNPLPFPSKGMPITISPKPLNLP